MTIDLPPRRELPADVKERMRPEFTEVRNRRNHTPLAVAAGVALLVAGGFAVTQSVTHDVDPAQSRVIMPSSQDLSRCRTALNDQSWSSTEMVAFGLRKVLFGKDGRFCELSRTTATVATPESQPTQLEAGSVTYWSSQVIAGVPPRGTRTVSARQVHPSDSRTFSDAVVTPNFFIVAGPYGMSATELIFDGRTVPIPRGPSLPIPQGPPPSRTRTVDSFDSGNSDPAAPVNLLAKCTDWAFAGSDRADDLQGWEPLLVAERHPGMLLAHRNHQEWASCALSENRTNALSRIRTASAGPDSATVLGGYQAEGEFIMVGRTHPSAKTVEVSDGTSPPVSSDVADGHFIARLPIPGGQMIIPANLHLIARNAGNEVVYEGVMS